MYSIPEYLFLGYIFYLFNGFVLKWGILSKRLFGKNIGTHQWFKYFPFSSANVHQAPFRFHETGGRREYRRGCRDAQVHEVEYGCGS